MIKISKDEGVEMKETSIALIDELTLRYPVLASCRLSVEAALEVLVK